MKKALSVIIVCVMLVGTVLSTAAADCNHSYTAKYVAADCREKAHTVYTCSLCGDSYTVYADDYTAPDGMYLLLSSERSGKKITVNCYYYNNAGLSGAQMMLCYNNFALKIESIQNSGKIWKDAEYVYGITWDSNADHITLYAESANGISNTSNGLCFTVVFEITNENSNPRIYFKKNEKSFVDWDDDNSGIIVRDPVIIDIIGKSDLGAHKYETSVIPATCAKAGATVYKCTVCGDSYSEVIQPSEHSFAKGKCQNCGAADPDAHTVTVDGKESVYSPGDTVTLDRGFYTNNGLAYRFIRWNGDTDVLSDATDGACVFTMPKRDLRFDSEYVVVGDINGDGSVNAIDVNLMRRMLVGLYSTKTPGADIDADGRVNAIDVNLLRRMLVGLYKPNK